MQTIISRSGRIPQNAGIIIYARESGDLNEKFLTAEEIRHIKRNTDRKKDEFTFISPGRCRFVVIGDKSRSGAVIREKARIKGSLLVQKINELKLHKVYLVSLPEYRDWVYSLAEGMALRNYRFNRYKSSTGEKFNSLSDIIIDSKLITEAETDELNSIIDATCKCRDMVNEPSSVMDTLHFAETVRDFCSASGCSVEILNKKKIESLKMGGLLAVNLGSEKPPVFVIVEWKPENAINKAPYILTGKGVMFDTGGMNVKTGDYMYNMKCDMAGAAAVVSALYLMARNKLPLHVIAIVPATDNRINSKAYVNGDIITISDGTRVEVINTDAEGRLILADALVYAKKYKPALVINLATLTGSAARAIGKYGIVAMSNSPESIFNKLRKSGDNVCERLVEFPLWEEYDDLIKSDIADIKNIGGTDAGAITAGKFLQHFTDYPFIHLDIAGPSFVEKNYNYRNTGGTGVGVRLLYDFFKNIAITLNKKNT